MAIGVKHPVATGLVLGLTLSFVVIGSCELLFPAKSPAEQLKAAIGEYNWACRYAIDDEISKRASKVAGLYRDAGDSENYRTWSELAYAINALHGGEVAAPDPSVRAYAEGRAPLPGALPVPERTDSLGQIIKATNDHPQYVSPLPVVPQHDPPRTYTYEEKQKMRADFLKGQEDAAQKKIDTDLENMAAKNTRKLAAQKDSENRQKFKIAIESSPFRPWKFLGGKPASAARISDYRDETFTLTKPDGKTIEIKRSKLNHADAEYADKWLKEAGAED